MPWCFGSLYLEGRWSWGRRAPFRYPGGKWVWFGQVITAEKKPSTACARIVDSSGMITLPWNIPEYTCGKLDGEQAALSKREGTAGSLKERYRHLARKNSCPVLWGITSMANSMRWEFVEQFGLLLKVKRQPSWPHQGKVENTTTPESQIWWVQTGAPQRSNLLNRLPSPFAGNENVWSYCWKESQSVSKEKQWLILDPPAHHSRHIPLAKACGEFKAQPLEIVAFFLLFTQIYS